MSIDARVDALVAVSILNPHTQEIFELVRSNSPRLDATLRGYIKTRMDITLRVRLSDLTRWQLETLCRIAEIRGRTAMSRVSQIEALVGLNASERMKGLFQLVMYQESQKLTRTLRAMVDSEIAKRKQPIAPPPTAPPPTAPPPVAPPPTAPPPIAPPPIALVPHRSCFFPRKLLKATNDWSLGTSSDTEIQETSATVSVLDPITLVPIKKPVRFQPCRHVQCFDFGTIETLKRKFNGHLNCPVCNIDVKPTDAVMCSTWFIGLLKNSDGNRFVEYKTADGTLMNCKDKSTTKRVQDQTSIDVDDDDLHGSSSMPISID